jgi:hypothetical protein
MLNKHKLLYEDERVYKTYLHCMKKAYRQKPDYWLLDFIRTGQQSLLTMKYSPWYRLFKLLSEQFSDRLVPIWIKSAETRERMKGKPLPPSSIMPKVLPSRDPYASTVYSLPEGLATYRGPYYGGPVKAGGILFRQQIPFEKEPVLYQRREDMDRGAAALSELASLLRQAQPAKVGSSLGSTAQRVNWGNRVGDSIAVRDPEGRDHIFDLIPNPDPKLKGEARRVTPLVLKTAYSTGIQRF